MSALFSSTHVVLIVNVLRPMHHSSAVPKRTPMARKHLDECVELGSRPLGCAAPSWQFGLSHLRSRGGELAGDGAVIVPSHGTILLRESAPSTRGWGAGAPAQVALRASERLHTP